MFQSLGYGVIFGTDLGEKQLHVLKQKILDKPRRFIAREIIDFIDIEVSEEGEAVMRKEDLRAFVLSGQKTTVWASRLTRFARK